MSLFKPYFPDYLGIQFGYEVEEEIADFIRETKCGETLRKSDHVVRKLKAFAVKSGLTSTVEDLPKQQLNQLLCSFVIHAKKENGEDYEVSSIKSLLSMFGSYVKLIQKGDVDQDGEYRGSVTFKRQRSRF